MRSASRKIKNIRLPQLVVMVICVLFGSLLHACEKLRVVGSDQWIPFAFAKESADSLHPTGIAYDVVRLIGQELGIPVQITIGLPWRRIELAMDKGTADILAGNYWTEERAKRWALSDAFANDEVRIFVRRENNFPFNSMSDLIGKRGVMPAGISLGQEFDSFKHNLDIHEVKLHTQMIDMLALERVDYMILPLLSGRLKIKDAGYENALVAKSKAVSVNAVHLSISRQSSCIVLLDRINQLIEQRKNDGSIAAIVAAYQ